jgi:hypothetical protein
MAWPKPEFQLDDSALEGFDCGPAAVCVAIDFMSRGRIHPSTENVRKKIPDHKGGTNPDGWAKALEAFAPAFRREGLTPPKFKRVSNLSHDMLQKQMKWGRGFLGVYDYGVVAARNKRLWSSSSFKGLHAMFQMKLRVHDDKSQTLVFDPLADGRKVGAKQMVKGPKWWAFPLTCKALESYSGSGEASGVIVWRSDVVQPDAPPPAPPDENDPSTDDPDDQLDNLDKMYGYLSDLEEQYAALGEVIDDLREAVGPDNDSTSDADAGVKE